MAERRRRERPSRDRVAPARVATRPARRRSTPSRTASSPSGSTRTVAGARPARPVRVARPDRKAEKPGRAEQQPPKRRATPEVRRRRSRLATVVFAVLLVGFVVAFVYPTRTYLRQRTELSSAETRLEVLERETRILEADTARLETDAEIERIAREQYGLIRPGEQPYVLVPESTTPAITPTPATNPPG